jgi:acyl carrier protein
MEHDGDLKSRIKRLLGEVTGDTSLPDRITESTDIINELGLDSIQMINFILMVEDELAIEIDFQNFDYSYFERFDSLCHFLATIGQPPVVLSS